jgi:hypothetical protein
MRTRWIRLTAALVLVACDHTDPFVMPPSNVGPSSTGSDVQLTFNVDQDYWPMWTADGRGILYSFVVPRSMADHRCLGLLPAAGGTRIWELCDNRAVRDDSVSSYTAYALDSSGRLLLVEAMSSTGFVADFPFHIRVQLTDTATPSVRSTLLTLPFTAGDVQVTWLSDMAWTGPGSVIALGQQFGEITPPGRCISAYPCKDSTFNQNGVVVTGAISGGAVTFQPVLGTDGATGYSLAENGATVAFITTGKQLYRVPAAGGDPVVVATVSTAPGTTLLGVTCRGSTCLVAVTAAGLTLTAQLVSVSLESGSTQVLKTATGTVFATPQLSPVSGDVVMQIGGALGHVSTVRFTGNADLHLLPGFLP